MNCVQCDQVRLSPSLFQINLGFLCGFVRVSHFGGWMCLGNFQWMEEKELDKRVRQMGAGNVLSVKAL